MLRTYKIQVKKGHKLFDYFNNLSFLSKNLFNTTNYYIKQFASAKQRLKDNKELHPNQEEVLNLVEYLTKDTKYYPSGDWLSYNTLDYIFKTIKHKDYVSLPSHSNQWIMKSLINGSYKSFFESLKAFKKNPSSFLGRPKLPKYKKKNEKSIIYFSNITCKIKDNKYLRFPKTKLQLNIGKLGMFGTLKQVRVIPHTTYFDVEVVLDIKTQEVPLREDNHRYLSIDLGLNNLCAIATSYSNKSCIIKGTPLKSINQYFNKKLSHYKSILKTINNLDYSKRIDTLYKKRNNKINDYMHKVSKVIIDKCINENISKIIIGYNDNWKQKINIGSQNNQNFVNIPYYKLLDKIEYKAKQQGIEIIYQEESYTSKSSFLDNDILPICNSNNKENYEYSGKRIKRGLYKSKESILINADINGSLNILRKYIIKKEIPLVLKDLWDIGCVEHPVVISI